MDKYNKYNNSDKSSNNSGSQWIAGIHAVDVALYGVDLDSVAVDKSSKIDVVYYDPDRKNKRLDKLIGKLNNNKSISLIKAKSDVINKHCGTDHHQGICARVLVPAVIGEGEFWDKFNESNLAEDKSALLLILDQVQDVHNLGACLRSANAAGVFAVIIPKNHSARYSAQVAKAASGATLQTPIVEVSNLSSFMKEIKKTGFWLAGFSDQAQQSYLDLDYSGPYALVMGGEHSGLRRLVLENCDELVSIPMSGCVSSLNVSVATGVALYGVLARRNKIA